MLRTTFYYQQCSLIGYLSQKDYRGLQTQNSKDLARISTKDGTNWQGELTYHQKINALNNVLLFYQKSMEELLLSQVVDLWNPIIGIATGLSKD